MNLAEQYGTVAREQIDEVIATQMGAIQAAGDRVAEALCQHRWIYAFGTGHSHMLAEELFYRAGGLVRIRPMLCSPLMLHESASDSTAEERKLEWVSELLSSYPVAEGDVLIIASNSGRNAVPVELALQARQRRASVIGLTNRRHSQAFESRHPERKKLADVADILLDNCGVVGDAAVPLGDGTQSIGAVSTVTGALIMQMLVCHAVEVAETRGWSRELFCSSNAGDEGHNDALLDQYRSQVRHL